MPLAISEITMNTAYNTSLPHILPAREIAASKDAVVDTLHHLHYTIYDVRALLNSRKYF